MKALIDAKIQEIESYTYHAEELRLKAYYYLTLWLLEQIAENKIGRMKAADLSSYLIGKIPLF